MLPDDEKKQLLSRLRRVEGQAGGLVRMVEADKYCIDILHYTRRRWCAVRGPLEVLTAARWRLVTRTLVLGQ